MFGSLGASTGRLGRLGLASPATGVAYQALLDLFASSEEGLLIPSINDARADGRLWQDSGQTTLATAVDDPVGYIEDFSGNGNDLSQSTAAARPLLKQDGNGNWYLQFDGTDDFLVTSSIDFTGTDKMFVCAGHRCAGASQMLLELGSNADSAGGFYVYSGSDSKTKFLMEEAGGGNAVQQVRVVAASYPLTEVWACDLDYAGSTRFEEMAGRINAGAVDLSSPASAANLTGSFQDDPLYIGARAGASLFWAGRLYGLCVRGAETSTAEIQATENYINSHTAAY